MRVALEVHGDQGQGVIAQDALEVGLAGVLEGGQQGLGIGLLFQDAVEVHHGDRGGGHAQGIAGEFAGQFGDDLGHGLGRTGGGGDDVAGGGAGTARVLVGHVEDALVVGVGMDGGHVAQLDAEVALQHQGHGRQAVGGARGVGHDVVLFGIVLVVVHAHDDGDVFFLGRSGDDDLFGAVVHMHGRLGGLAEDAGAFHHHVHVMLAPGQLMGIALGEAVDVPVTDLHFLTVHLGVQEGAAVDGVVLQQLEVGGGVEEVVDGHHFHAISVALAQGAEHLAADAAETIDTDTNFFHCIHLCPCGHPVLMGAERHGGGQGP